MPQVNSMTPMETLLYFVRKREAIRVKKEAGQPTPWTEDPILAKYRFCNVRRRDDRVSRWLLKRYYPKFERRPGEPKPDVWFAAAIARLINWPPTLAHLLETVIPLRAEEYDHDEFGAELEHYHKKGVGKTYTGAYMLYGGGRNPRYKGVVKSRFISHHILPDLVAHADAIREAVAGNSVRRVVEVLKTSFAFSDFMAGQVAADLTYLPGQLDKALDLFTYAPQGPGSIRGLNRLNGLPLNQPWKQGDFEEALIALLNPIEDATGLTDLSLQDVQSCLCEADKYMRVLNDEGKPRSLYIPETAY